MAQAIVALRSARTLLNDVQGITWTDAILIPMLQEAHRELLLELKLHSIPVIMTQAAIFTVPAGTTSLKTAVLMPADLLEPISMKERQINNRMEDFVDMQQLTFLPTVTPGPELTYWAWMGEDIKLVSATQDREVVLRYRGSIVTPQAVTDNIGVLFGELYLGPRIAALAYASIGRDPTAFVQKAGDSLNKVIRSAITADQRPIRRKAYRGRKTGTGFPI